MTERHVLITGASSGIGRALVEEYAAMGAKITLIARREKELREICAGLLKRGARVQSFILDVTNDKAVRSALTSAESEFGPVDTVFANAGIGVDGSVVNQTQADFAKQLDVNFWGVLHVFYAALESLKKTRGRFVITGSGSGYLSLPSAVGYSVSKFAVRALAEGLYTELGPWGISVTLLSPGFIATEIRGPKDPVPRWLQMPVQKAARKMVRATERRQREVIITFHNRLAIWISRLVPGLLLYCLRRLETARAAGAATARSTSARNIP